MIFSSNKCELLILSIQSIQLYIKFISLLRTWVRVVVLNATFNIISVILWRTVLLVEETGLPGGKSQNFRKSLTNFIT